MKRVAALLAILGIVGAASLELGDRSSCPVGGGECVLGPTYAWLHPLTPGFNHVFGALVFLAVLLLPLGVSVFLVIQGRPRVHE